jgi:hypothetical protein
MTDALPGAIGVSYLDVYESMSPDGQAGGTPHVHLACTEAYVVQAGRGRVQTLGADGFDELPVGPLDVVWFMPGIVHRLVNDGGLQIVVIMENQGLAEAGDAVFAFPPEVLADPEAYARAATLRDGATPQHARDRAARERRDLAVRGFSELRERFEREGAGALERFWTSALAIVRGRLPEWEERWRRGELAAAQRTGDVLSGLQGGEIRTLSEARVSHTRARDNPRRLGMCGRLASVDPEASITMQEIST